MVVGFGCWIGTGWLGLVFVEMVGLAVEKKGFLVAVVYAVLVAEVRDFLVVVAQAALVVVVYAV